MHQPLSQLHMLSLSSLKRRLKYETECATLRLSKCGIKNQKILCHLYMQPPSPPIKLSTSRHCFQMCSLWVEIATKKYQLQLYCRDRGLGSKFSTSLFQFATKTGYNASIIKLCSYNHFKQACSTFLVLPAIFARGNVLRAANVFTSLKYQLKCNLRKN